MRLILIFILTIIPICSNVYADGALEALEEALEEEQTELHMKSIDELKRFDRLRKILRSMKQQERDNEVIKEWETHRNESPCDSIFRDGFECEKVRI